MASSLRELEVLALIVADGDQLGVVEEDVGRHQHGVGEHPGLDRLLARALLLELGHAAQLAHRGRALEQPRELLMGGHVALDEQGAPLGIETRCEQQAGGVDRLSSKLGGLDGSCQCVEIDHAVEGIGAVLLGHPLAHRTEVVAEMQIT